MRRARFFSIFLKEGGGVTFAAALLRKKNFFLIFSKMTFLGVILCEKSIARIEKF